MPNSNRNRGCPLTHLLCMACGFAALVDVPARAQAPIQEVVLHDFGSLPAGTLGANPSSGVIGDGNGNLYGTTVNGGAAKLGIVYQLDVKGHEKVLYSFTGIDDGDGANPSAGVIRDTNGNLYGTTANGGASDAGVVYELDATGHESVLHAFTGGADGANPSSGVVRDSAGNLYGTTSHGGAANAGVVYEIDATGQETVLYSFSGGTDGAGPNSLFRDTAGNLFGTTAGGGPGKAGVVYKLDTTGHETVVYYFAGGLEGATPVGVTGDAAGNLYGATAAGGSANAGIVFMIAAAGPEKILYSFKGGSDGKFPAAGVVRDSAGNLYGTTASGGSSAGVVYKVDPAGNEAVLYSFSGGTDGSSPVSGVLLDASGDLYGTTPSPGSGVVYKIDATGHETVLSSFTTLTIDGDFPESGVILDAAGNLYGTTAEGGATEFGTVYKLDATGREVLLHVFAGGADGAYPYAGVTLDVAGNLYGTTQQGGSAGGHGVVYKVDATGQETVLYAFSGGTDGGQPFADVVLDTAGNLYGTAAIGGFGHGVIYKLDAAGQETVLHNFGGGLYGDYPYAGVIGDAAGNLYGTTVYGGTANAGIVYKLDAEGGFTVLHSFTGLADGGNPYAGVTRDAAGNLYGTTTYGGASGDGVVFKVDTAGNYTVVYSFCEQFGCTDGGHPMAGVIRDAAGNLYGTTSSFGRHRSGAVFMVDADGQETVLYSFTGGPDGRSPYAGLTPGPAGELLGTTAQGGKESGGVVFEVKPTATAQQTH